MQRSVVLALPALVAATVVMAGLAACGTGGDPADSRATATVTASQSAVAASPVDTSPPSTPSDPVAVADGPAPTSTGGQAARPAVTGIPRTLSSADDTVSAETFRYDPSGNAPGYYFRSPTGNVACGVDDIASTLALACTARQSVRNTIAPPCANTEESSYAVLLYKAGGRQNQCLQRSIVSGEYHTPSGTVIQPKILDYGQVVTIDGVTCASTTSGITCFHRGVGFSLARDRNVIH